MSWTSNQKTFEGEGGLHNPSALTHEYLDKADAIYETPVAVLQYQMSLAGKANESIKLVFGAAKTNDEIAVIKKIYLRFQIRAIKLLIKNWFNIKPM